MSIPYSQKQNLRPVSMEVSIINEPHVVGIVGVATVMANTVKLIEVPSPNHPVTVPGYTITTNPTPSIGFFYVDYVNGYLTFNSSANGVSVVVSYYGRGSEIDSIDINEVQEPLSVLATIDGTLTPNSIIYGVLTVTNPASITTSNVDNHTGLIVVASAPTTLTIPSPTNTTMGRFFTVLNKSTSTQSISVNGNTLLVSYGATWIWDGLAWLLVSPIPGTTGVPVVASDPSSPFQGQLYFNSTSNQFIGWNGSSWVVLG
jgi:hypothetical protein